ncbi:MAG: beta-N-acetylhexosaminidase [Aestuariibacter sp.]
MGPLMLDLSGYELTQEEQEILQHPLVGGVIYFTRNFHDAKQIEELVRHTREAAKQPLMLAVDHEGGRVQRFRNGFTHIPAMADFEAVKDLPQQQKLIHAAGWLMAAEVLSVGIDISFAPVLDIHGISDVIGDRSFSADAQTIKTLAKQFILGMKLAGMQATGKHFPGHGNVKEDSHIALPVDKRSLQEILDLDAEIFADLIQNELLQGIMPAHVIYSEADDMPAGFSKYWVQTILRKKMSFNGVIFSDDLAMQGAVHLGTPAERATKAMDAGCDMVLMCNDRAGAVHILDNLSHQYAGQQRLAQMCVAQFPHRSLNELQKTTAWAEAKSLLESRHEI